jgi:hypothetical protein
VKWPDCVIHPLESCLEAKWKKKRKNLGMLVSRHCDRAWTLPKDGQPNEALHILDDAIAQAIEEERGMWVGILCRHAAVLAHAKGEIRRGNAVFRTGAPIRR